MLHSIPSVGALMELIVCQKQSKHRNTVSPVAPYRIWVTLFAVLSINAS